MIASTVSRISYAGTGSTGPFGFGFKVFDPAHLLVTKRSALGAETTLVYLTDYTVVGIKSGVDNFGAGGIVTLTLPLAVGEILVIRRSPPDVQSLSVQNAGPFFPKGYEDQLDYLTMLVQSAVDLVTRAFKIGETQDPTVVSTTLPTPAADNVLGWSGDGKSLVNKTTIPGQQINTAQDPQDFKSKFPVPGLDLLVSILSKRGIQHFNESGVLESLSDAGINHVVPWSFRHKAWGSTYADGTSHLLTAPEIAAHPEWIGKYFAGVDVRDDVLCCEAHWNALANQGVKARGVIASVTDHGGGGIEFGLTFDSGASIDPSVGLVSALPLMGAGLYLEGVRGASFYTVDGQFPFVLHNVDSNTANSVSVSETGTLLTPSVGEHFELVQFNGSGMAQYNKRIELGNGSYRLTRPIPLQFTKGAQIIGCGRFATTLTQTTKDLPLYTCNGVEYSHFEAFQAANAVSSTRALFEMDYSGFVNGNSNAAASNQSNTWQNCYFQGSGAPSVDPRLGTAAAPIALTAIGGDGHSLSLTTPRALKVNELQNCWLVIDTCPGDAANGYRRLGFRYRISFHNAAAAGATVTFTFDNGAFIFPPVAGGTPDTVHVEIGTHAAIEWGLQRVAVNGSSGPQGSENLVLTCYATSFTTAAYCSMTGNALQQSYIGGNIASCPNWGIFHNWGNAVISGVGFQAGSDSVQNQFTYMRGNPSLYGFDIILRNSAIETSRIHGCRSESARFLRNDGAQMCSVEDCGWAGQIIGPNSWQAGMNVTAHANSTGLPTITSANAITHRDGGLWVVWQIDGGTAVVATTTSAVEPLWDTAGQQPGYGLRNVNEANAGGGAHTINWLEMDTYLNTLHNGDARAAFNAIDGNSIVMNDIVNRYGKISIDGNDIGLIRCNRKDWYASSSSGADWRGGKANGWRIRGPVFVQTPTDPTTVYSTSWGFFAGGGNNAFDQYPLGEKRGVVPSMFVMGGAGKALYEAGIGPGDLNDVVIGLYGRGDTDFDYGKAYLAAPAPHNPRDWSDLGAGSPNGRGGVGFVDLAGLETKIAGGKGTSAGTPGPLGVYVGVPTASGSVRQSYVKIAQFDADTTAGNTRFMLWDVTAGTLKRVSVGAADSGGAGFKVLRVPN